VAAPLVVTALYLVLIVATSPRGIAILHVGWLVRSLVRVLVSVFVVRSNRSLVKGCVKSDQLFMGNPSQNYRASPAHRITQCYLPPDTGERARLNPSQ